MSMLRDLAERLRNGWQERRPLALVVTRNLDMARWHLETQPAADGNRKGEAIYRSGGLYFVPMRMIPSQDSGIREFESLLTDHCDELAGLTDHIKIESSVLRNTVINKEEWRQARDVPIETTEGWDSCSSPWPALLAWFHRRGHNLLNGGPDAETGYRRNIVTTMAGLLTSIPADWKPEKKLDETRQNCTSDSAGGVLTKNHSDAAEFSYSGNWMTEGYAMERFRFIYGQVSKAARNDNGLYGQRVERRKAQTAPGKPPEFVYHAGQVQLLRTRIDETNGE